MAKRRLNIKKPPSAETAESRTDLLNESLTSEKSASGDSENIDYTALTNVELARIIVENGWSSRAESTLNRLSKDELTFICKNKSDESLERVTKANAETASDIVGAIVDFLDEIHEARDGAKNNESLSKFTRKQSVAIAPFINQLAFTNFGIIALALGIALLTFDSFYGFKNLKNLINGKK